MHCTILGPERPLFFDGDTLYASRGLSLLASFDEGRRFAPVATYPASMKRRLFAGSANLSRITRAGFHALLPLQNGALVGVVRKEILYKSALSESFKAVHPVDRGSRPLNLCGTPDGRVYYGEYFNNPGRDEVHIYGSVDGEQWGVVYTFAPGRIRHIHGLCYDRYRKGIWVLTGDNDQESGLWFTADHFKTIECVAGGSQHARAVSIIPCSEGIIVPMDTPREVNHIQWMDPATGHFESVATVPGSVFHAARMKDLLLVTTVAEPSEVNTLPDATVFVSREGTSWSLLDTFKRSTPGIVRKWDKYLRYPEVALTPGSADATSLFGWGIAVKPGNRMLRWDYDTVRKALD